MYKKNSLTMEPTEQTPQESPINIPLWENSAIHLLYPTDFVKVCLFWPSWQKKYRLRAM